MWARSSLRRIRVRRGNPVHFLAHWHAAGTFEAVQRTSPRMLPPESSPGGRQQPTNPVSLKTRITRRRLQLQLQAHSSLSRGETSEAGQCDNVSSTVTMMEHGEGKCPLPPLIFPCTSHPRTGKYRARMHSVLDTFFFSDPCQWRGEDRCIELNH